MVNGSLEKTMLTMDQGATSIADRAAFDRLARATNVPGATNVPEVKLLIMGVDGATPQLYFLNTNNFPFHYFFYRDVLEGALPLEAFNDETYQRLPGMVRRNLAGSLMAHDSYQSGKDRGLFALEF